MQMQIQLIQNTNLQT